MTRAAPIALAALFALPGCDRGWGLDVNVTVKCVPETAEVEIAVTVEPPVAIQPKMIKASALAGGQGRVVVVPPDGTSRVHVEMTARDGAAVLAHDGITVEVAQHQVATANIVLDGCGADAGTDGGAGCTSAASCPKERPQCEADAGRCVECLDRSDCAGNELCVANQCRLGCTKNADCAQLPGQTLCCNGTCADLKTDVNNCGSCGIPCMLPNATPFCGGGMCGVTSCGAGFGDCDKVPQNGCETNTSTDLANCGSCGQACLVANGKPGCAAAMCTVQSCNAPFGDCDGMAANGCEANTNSDPGNCGGCKMACPNFGNGVQTCVAGTCGGTCNMTFADCDQKAGNGCEVHLPDDKSNCGMCGRVCTVANGAAGCVAGACVVASCNNGFDDCNKSAGDGCEATLATDPKNCGQCGKLCSPNETCVAGTCKVNMCAPPSADCDGNGSCEVLDINTDPLHCGGCSACSGNHITPACSGGNCTGVCLAGFGDCNANKRSDGCETSIGNNPDNCGGCAIVCSGAHISVRQCANGNCSGACDAGFADCNSNKLTDGCEISTTDNPQNCGACGRVCSSNNVSQVVCSGSACTSPCKAGFADCNNNKQFDGCETNIIANAGDCGGCGMACSSNNIQRSCMNYQCNGACNAGFADCNNDKRGDGCEVNTGGDVANCGGCGMACSTNNIFRMCSGGQCTGGCSTGFADCNNDKRTDGCEVNTQSDHDNCGGCGKGCAVDEVCSQGVCIKGCMNTDKCLKNNMDPPMAGSLIANQCNGVKFYVCSADCCGAVLSHEPNVLGGTHFYNQACIQLGYGSAMACGDDSGNFCGSVPDVNAPLMMQCNNLGFQPTCMGSVVWKCKP